MNSITPTTSSATCPCRILIVDDNLNYRGRYAAYAKELGAEVFVAEGELDALVQDAKAKAFKHRCHIALVDMRLKDHEDRGDFSGLDLADAIKPTSSIIVSAFGDIAIAVEAVKQKRIYHFVAKDEGPAHLIQVLRQAIAIYSPCSPELHFPSDYNESTIAHRLKLGDATVPIEEPLCALRRIYNTESENEMATHINRIARVEFVLATTHYYRPSEEVTPLERSVVLIAQSETEQHHWAQEKIIKIASAKQILDEVEGYRKYVKPFLSPQRTARLEDSRDYVLLWDVGAILYTNIATNDREPLRSWYTLADSREVVRALQDLFNETLNPWYRQHSEQNYGSVYEYFASRFEKLGGRLANYKGTNKYIDIPGAPLRLLNPILWAKNNAAQSRFLSRWTAFIHGDLHSDNIFVDQHAQTSIIDYERSGPGYVLRDFAELETEIRLRLLPLHSLSELKLAYELDLLLFAPDRPSRLPKWKEIGGLDAKSSLKLRKAFDAIVALRQLANHSVGFTKMREYYWALLMETLFSVLRNYAEWENQIEAELARTRALLAAALLAERLDHWNEKWTPDEWNRRPQYEFSHGYALLIGVGNNQFESRWSLPVSVQDATKVYQVLNDPNRCAYPRHQIHLLHDGMATAERIRTETEWLCEQANRDPEATIVFYFSGHGWQSAKGEYALIPHDANPDQFESTILWGKEISELLHAISAQRLLVILDTCHADGVVQLDNENMPKPIGFSQVIAPQTIFADLRRGTGRIVLSSAGKDQKSYPLRDESASIFTYHLIEALSGNANKPEDKLVMVSDVIKHLTKQVQESVSREYQRSQTPQSDWKGEDFAIALLSGGKRQN